MVDDNKSPKSLNFVYNGVAIIKPLCSHKPWPVMQPCNTWNAIQAPAPYKGHTKHLRSTYAQPANEAFTVTVSSGKSTVGVCTINLLWNKKQKKNIQVTVFIKIWLKDYSYILQACYTSFASPHSQ